MLQRLTEAYLIKLSPFHAALGIMTGRMLLHLHKAVAEGRVIQSGGLTGTHNIGSFNAYPMHVLSTDAAATWNCAENSALGSTTLIESVSAERSFIPRCDP